MPPRGGGRSGSGPSDSKPPALPLRRIMQERRSSVKGSSSSRSTGSKSTTGEGATGQSVPRSVSSSSSSSLSTEVGSDSDSDSGYGSGFSNDFRIDSDYGDSDSQSGGFEPNARGKLIASITNSLPCHGIMLLLFETPSGFALCTFPGVYCYLPDSVDNIWAEFGDPLRASWIVYPKGFLSLEDKSSAITDAGVDKQLVDLINKWHHPGMNLCVGKPEYKRIIESVLKIPCMCCQTVMEIMWGLQQQLRALMPTDTEKSKLTKEDRLPTSQGLMKFLSNCGFDVKPEMVNEKIFLTACALFHCDVDDEKNLGLLRDAGLNIRDISGIACGDWDILQLAIAVKVICFPEEELTDFHEVLAEDVVSKLKGDAHKYKGNPVKVCWLRAYKAAVSNHHLRIAKKKLLESLVKKAKKVYEAEQAEVCEKGKLQEVVRRSSRLNPKLYEKSMLGRLRERDYVLVMLGLALGLGLALVLIRLSHAPSLFLKEFI